ncbi:MAG: hypothetical protein ACLUJR_15180 [Mediterraneibacter gnavus]
MLYVGCADPFKKELPEYQEQEEHLLRMIYEKFLGSTLTSGSRHN